MRPKDASLADTPATPKSTDKPACMGEDVVTRNYIEFAKMILGRPSRFTPAAE
jgi:hypothetical protein